MRPDFGEKSVTYDPVGMLNAMIPDWIKEKTVLTIAMRNGFELTGIITRTDSMQVGTGYVPNATLLLEPNSADCAIDMDNVMDMYIKIEEISHIRIKVDI